MPAGSVRVVGRDTNGSMGVFIATSRRGKGALLLEEDKMDCAVRSEAVHSGEQRTETQDGSSSVEKIPSFEQIFGLGIVALAVLHGVALAIEGVALTDCEQLFVDRKDEKRVVRDSQGQGDSTVQVRSILCLVVKTGASESTDNDGGYLVTC